MDHCTGCVKPCRAVAGGIQQQDVGRGEICPRVPVLLALAPPVLVPLMKLLREVSGTGIGVGIVSGRRGGFWVLTRWGAG